MSGIYLVGIDEVGRGPIAGPVTVCACAVEKSAQGKKLLKKLSVFDARGALRDSKRMDGNLRADIARRARVLSDGHGVLRFAIASVSQKFIDTKGIAPAVRMAIARALSRLKLDSQLVEVRLDGGIRAPKSFRNQKTIVKGDQKEPVIALASVIAKDFRDRKMKRLSKRYPSYGFEFHAGYGTAFHYRAIRRFGITEIHRRSFLKQMALTK